jgi:hypothetical protein
VVDLVEPVRSERVASSLDAERVERRRLDRVSDEPKSGFADEDVSW